MKIYSRFFPLALAGLMLGACSNEDVTDPGKGGGAWNSEGKGYVSVAIKLPTTPASRANDVTDDGTADEYEVKNATLILFNGTSESTATLNSAYTITPDFSHDGSAQITTTANVTQKINSIAGTDNIYALVVLNHQGLFAVEENNALLKVNNVSMANKTIDQLNDAVKEAIGTDYSWHRNGFLMSNAVLTEENGGASLPGGDASKIQTLSKIDRTNIHETEAEATADPAAIIYVERAEAKVTLVDAAQNKTVTDGSGYTYTIDGWTLDNTNKTSKLIRTVGGYATWAKYASNSPSVTGKYRFVGNVPVGENILGETLYRVYWGEDYNYTSTVPVTDLTYFADGTVPSSFNALGSSAYCFENTADLNTMREDKCTRAIVKATFNGGNPFCIIDGNVSSMLSVEDSKKEAAARIVADGDVSKWLQANLKAGETFNSETDIVVTLPALKAGRLAVANVTLADDVKDKFKAGTDVDGQVAGWTAVANRHIDIEYYAGGAAYYPVYVAHFGEDLTPWDKDETAKPTTENVYPGGDANYLGRWSVLRNNWYQINVTSIRSIGAPTVEEATGTIDKKESYISVTVNTLPWAVRTQDAEL